ncbi:enoyl-CoA hydratase/isomerase family protein [Sphingomonas sp. ID0503]|uniref:enoyl-CoA hydratase/isomerase family protein n=1 Tax=Sphingomonas sp. ID0503 TaxID=3399691 RepID=UPI003AFB0B94
MSADRILLTIDGAIATVAINRPEARNGLVRGMGAEIHAKLREVAANKNIRVLVFRGIGRDFCPGADIKAQSTPDETPPPTPDFDAYQVSVLLHEMPQVTIAAIRGACAGAGLGYAAACDLRVGDDDVRINSAFLDVGVAGDMGVPWSLPRLIGPGLARDLMFFPRKIGSDEALRIGLLQRVWPGETFEEELARYTARLAGAAPLALTAMKANFVEAERTDLRSFITIEAERHIRLLQTADRTEAFKAWVEKRAAKFTGR